MERQGVSVAVRVTRGLRNLVMVAVGKDIWDGRQALSSMNVPVWW